MVLKREDTLIVPDEPIAPSPGVYGGTWVSPSTVLNIPWSLIDQLTISLGGGGLFSQPINDPGWRISQVAEQPATLQEAALPPTGDRRDQPPIQGELPVVEVTQAADWFEYWELIALSLPVAPPIGQGGPVNPPSIIEEEAEEPDMGILGDIYTVADTMAGGWLPNIGGYGVDPGYGVSLPALGMGGGVGGFPPGATMTGQPIPLPQGGMVPPPPPSVGAIGCDPVDPYKGYVLKRHCGQWRWIKKKHRRRKQLFTQRDASQLSSLIGIAGKSVITKTWIASHPS